MPKSWLKALKGGSASVASVPKFDDAVTGLREAKSGVNGIDDAIKDLPFSKLDDEVMVNNARWRDVEPHMRKGNVREAFSKMEVGTTIKASDESTLKVLLKDTSPDIDIGNMDKKLDTAKKYNSDIDVKPGANGTELEGKLDAKSKEKVKSIYSKLVTAAGVAAIGTGIFCTIMLTGNMWDNLAEATNARDGCYMVYKSTNTQACKLINRSCGTDSNGTLPCDPTAAQSVTYNIYLMCHDILAQNDEIAIRYLKDFYGIILSNDTVDAVLADPANTEGLCLFYPIRYPTHNETFDPCILGELTTGCVACDPTNVTASKHFADISELEGDLTIKCITDSTVLGTLVDVATDMGVEIFDAIGDSISGSFRGNFILAVAIILIIIVIIAIVLKFKPLKKIKNVNNNMDMTPQSVRDQQSLMNQQISMNQNTQPGTVFV